MLLDFFDEKCYDLRHPFLYRLSPKVATRILRWENNGLAFSWQIYDSRSE